MSNADFGHLDLAALCAATGYAESAQALTGLLSTDRYFSGLRRSADAVRRRVAGDRQPQVAYLGWHQVDGPRWKDLEEFLFDRAMEHDSPKLLFRLACEDLSSSRLVRPGAVLVLERVAAARKRHARRRDSG